MNLFQALTQATSGKPVQKPAKRVMPIIPSLADQLAQAAVIAPTPSKARAQSIANAGKGAEVRRQQGQTLLNDIYEFLADGKKVTAQDVALKFGIHHTTATTRLRTLFENDRIFRAVKHLDGHTYSYWRGK